MKPFKMRKKNVMENIYFGIWWAKLLKNRVGQGCIFHAIIPAHHTF